MPIHSLAPRPRSLQRQSGALKHNLIGALLVIIGFTAMIWLALPPTYNTDLALIGKGKPAIVLVYDNENVASMTLIENFNKFRDKYEGTIEFIIADFNLQAGEQFANTHQVHSASALYFNHEGQRVLVFNGPQEETVIRDSIQQSFGL